jgi:bifunctional DNA-binding transcriptional regulator/antitoxin component of YhaV-PrlF toxin-antitoxin module
MGKVEEFVRPLTAKGTVTIPVKVRRLLGLTLRDKVRFRVVDDKHVQLLPPPMTLEQAYGSVKPLRRRLSLKRIREIAIEDHIEGARKRRSL